MGCGEFFVLQEQNQGLRQNITENNSKIIII